MHMVGQQHPGIDREWPAAANLKNGFMQGATDIRITQDRLASRGDHGEKITAAGNSSTSVVWHGFNGAHGAPYAIPDDDEIGVGFCRGSRGVLTPPGLFRDAAVRTAHPTIPDDAGTGVGMRRCARRTLRYRMMTKPVSDSVVDLGVC